MSAHGAGIQLLRDRGRTGASRRPFRKKRLSLGQLAGAFELVGPDSVSQGAVGGWSGARVGEALRLDRRGGVRRTLRLDHGSIRTLLSALAVPLVRWHVCRLSSGRGRCRDRPASPGRALFQGCHHQSIRLASECQVCLFECRFLGGGPFCNRERRGEHAAEHDRGIRFDSGGEASGWNPGAEFRKRSAYRAGSHPGRLSRSGELVRHQQQGRPQSRPQCRGRHSFRASGKRTPGLGWPGTYSGGMLSP